MHSDQLAHASREQQLVETLATLDGRLPRTELIHRALAAVLAVTGAERATLFLLTPDRSALQAHTAAGPGVRPFRCEIGKGLVGACFRSGAPLLVPDARQDPRFNREIDLMTGFETRSVLAAPLVEPCGGVVGVVEAISSAPGRFAEADQERLRCFAAPIMLALSVNETFIRARRETSRAVRPPRAPIGESPAFLAAMDRAGALASTDASVLVLGETGSGKEAMARFIHSASARREGPFVAVNCAAVPEALAESLLFGHRKGAFTGAAEDAEGYVEQADGGTLFLDEVGEMPPAVQAKLLRVLQDGLVQRVGEATAVRVDVRILAATNRVVTPGRTGASLREDLFFRLARFTLTVPPLRERGQDAVLIFTHLLRNKLGEGVRISAALRAELAENEWPGNVRQLEAAVEHAALFGRGAEEVDVEHVREALVGCAEEEGRLPLWLLKGTWEQRKDRLLKAVIEDELARHGGSPSAAAQVLDIPRSTFARFRASLRIDAGREAGTS